MFVGAAVLVALGWTLQGTAAKPSAAGSSSHPLKITLESNMGISPDGLGDYVHGVAGVTATYTDSTGTVTFANAAPAKGKTGRLVYIDLSAPASSDYVPIFPGGVYLSSWMKPTTSADGFYDMRAMNVGQKSVRKWNVQWPGSNITLGTYHLHWDPAYFPSDTTIDLTCVAQGIGGSGPCTVWQARPVGTAGVRHVYKLSKNVPLYQDDGYYNVPFVMTIQQCDVAGSPC